MSSAIGGSTYPLEIVRKMPTLLIQSCPDYGVSQVLVGKL